MTQQELLSRVKFHVKKTGFIYRAVRMSKLMETTTVFPVKVSYVVVGSDDAVTKSVRRTPSEAVQIVNSDVAVLDGVL
ncbi:hypothetical protein GCM10007082_08570 [Oceanisphaera arctica]|nr:hypothetical protein GCM10007082_08570 [Oceanisphaera arctica]